MKKIALLVFAFFIICQIYAQNFNLEEFSNTDKYGWTTKEKQLRARGDLLDRQKLLQIYSLKKQSKTKNMIKSVFAPGWGHFSAKRYTKGEILLGIEIALFGSSLYFYDQAMEKYNKYKNANYVLDINKYYEDAKLPYLYAQGFFALGAAIWVYTIYDASLVTEDYNNELWDSIMEKYHDKNFQITPTGFSWRF